jgi:hypothetical protein
MKQPLPLELLEDKLNELEKALHKSFLSFQKNEISGELHLSHKNNLQPLIFKYKQTIQFIKQLTDY